MSNEKDKGTEETKGAVEKGAVAETVETTETAKAEKGTEKAKDASAGKTKEYFEEQGEKSKKNRSQGGEDVKVSLTNKTLVRFKANHGFFKKGHEQEVSDVALAIYEKAGVVEKL